MLAKNICLALLGFSAGITAAGGLFSFIIGLGVISDFADRTHTGEQVMLYEDAVAAGGSLGAVISVYHPAVPFAGCLLPVMGLMNDKIGNPILIGLVLVWKLKDTYKAMFEIDAQTMADNKGTGQMSVTVAGRMNAFEDFVRVQSDAALRQVAGLYAYDDNEANSDELTLRSGGDEINDQLEHQLNERLAMAGMEIVEARINYLAYAPEIAAVMLRRQQASAIISAREKIVEGAVSMVRMALHKLSEEEIVELDEDKKAAMVSNLLVVLCADEAAQPVVNTGTLNH